MAYAGHNTARIEWQRSEAQFIYSELASEVFPVLVERVDDRYLDRAADTLERKATHGLDRPWLCATMAAMAMLDASCSLPAVEAITETVSTSDELAEGQRKYTYEASVEDVFSEALITAAFWPPKLLRILDQANRQAYNTHLVRDNQDLQTLIESPELSEFIHGMALAKNGYWPAILSNDSTMPMIFAVPHVDINKNLRQQPGSRLGFSLDMADQLDNIRTVNTYSLEPPLENFNLPSARSTALSQAATAGCPVRLAKPSFNSETSQAYLQNLASGFGKTPAEIVAERPRSGIQLGIDSYAGILRKTIDYVDRVAALPPNISL